MIGRLLSGKSPYVEGVPKSDTSISKASCLEPPRGSCIPFKAPPVKAAPPQPPDGKADMVKPGGPDDWEPPAKRIKGSVDMEGSDSPVMPKGMLSGFLSQRMEANPFPQSKAASAPAFGALPKGLADFAKRPPAPSRMLGSGDSGKGLRAPAPRVGPTSGPTPKPGSAFEHIMQQSQKVFDQMMQQSQGGQGASFQQREDELRMQAEESRKQEEEAQKRRAEEFRKQHEEMLKQQEEFRKLERERKRLEEEQRKEEADTTARVLQAELSGFVGVAETKGSMALDLAEPFKDVVSMGIEEIIRVAESFECARLDAQEALKACATFTAGKHRTLVGATDATKKSASELIARIGKVDRSLNSMQAKVRQHKIAADQRKMQEARKEAAVKEAKRQEELFKQYDSDGDGKLSAEDIISLCAEEFQFELSKERLEGIKRSEAYKLAKGVPYSKFPQLKTLIGIARGEVLSKQRKEEAERKRVIAAGQIEVVKKKAAAVNECMAGIEAEVSKAEQKAVPLGAIRGRAPIPANIEVTISDVDTAIDAARDFLAAAQEQVDKIGGETGASLESEAQKVLVQTSQQINLKLKHFENRVTRAASVAKAAREKVELQQRKEALLREATAMQ